MTSEYQHWLLSEQARIATLTLNRPDATNSLTPEVFYELRDITACVEWIEESIYGV